MKEQSTSPVGKDLALFKILRGNAFVADIVAADAAQALRLAIDKCDLYAVRQDEFTVEAVHHGGSDLSAYMKKW